MALPETASLRKERRIALKTGLHPLQKGQETAFIREPDNQI
jgi:hypothetical protein